MMATGGDVRIRLTVDGDQARRQIKLIDDDLKQLGQDQQPELGADPSKPKPDTEHGKDDIDSSTDSSQQKQQYKVLTLLTKEMVLIRKELQVLNKNGLPSSNPAPSPLPPAPGNPSQNPPQGTPPANPPENEDNNKGIKNILGALGKAAGVLGAAAIAYRAITSIKNFATANQSGQSMAYQTYGSTLAYTNYNTARKEAGSLGQPYGYNYETVMQAANANMSRAGYVDKESYNADMFSILGTAKAYGIDAATLANVSGRMTSYGVTDIGEQKQFTDLLAQSIQSAGMTGREDEQLNVLEQIADLLEQNASTVSRESVNSSLNMYNALVAQNENLKGTRGANVVNSMTELAQSGNTSLDILAGWGTKYTGVAGQLELRKLAETDQQQYWSQVYEGYQQRFGDSSWDNFQYFLSNQLGSASKAGDIVASLQGISSGAYDITSTEAGEAATQERLANYNGAQVANLEQYEAAKKSAQENVGGVWNTLTTPWRKWFTGLGDDTQSTLTGAGAIVSGAVGTAAPLIAAQAGIKGLTKLIGKSAAGAGGAGAGGAGAGGAGAGGAGAGAGGASGIMGTLATIGAGGTKGAEAASKLVGTGGKIAGAAGTVIEIVDTVGDTASAISRGDSRDATSEIGQGIGHIAGMWAGGAAGAKIGAAIGTAIAPGIGTAIGGVLGTVVGGGIGAFTAGKAGEAVFEGGYDFVTGGNKPQYSEEQRQQIQQYYTQVQDIYQNQGNNAAQNYVNNVVAPYLESIGVSKSTTKHYGIDVGTPDFLKDVKKGTFGNILTPDDSTSQTVSAIAETAIEAADRPATRSSNEIQDMRPSYMRDLSKVTDDQTEQLTSNTEALKANTEALTRYTVDSSVPLSVDTGSNSKEVTTSGNTVSMEANTQKTSLWSRLTSWATGNTPTVDASNYSGTSGSFDTSNGMLPTTRAVGHPNIPFDDYPALLHKGEAVLNRYDAEAYRRGRMALDTDDSQITGAHKNTVTLQTPNDQLALPPAYSGLLTDGSGYSQIATVGGDFNLNIKVSGAIDGINPQNQQVIVQAVVAQISQSGLRNMLSNSWVRAQNK